MSGLKSRLAAIQSRINRAAESAQRDPADIKLIAVTKTYPVETLLQAYDLGLRNFGENRLQDAVPKIEALPEDINWHFLGPLQSNKAKKAAAVFRCIHSLESQGQLREIEKSGCKVDGFLQVNVGGEQQKAGVSYEGLDAALANVLCSPSVRLLGLMTIGPLHEEPEGSRSVFRELAKLAKERGLTGLSMGMSGDFEIAIQEGSTHVRIGSALFGERTKTQGAQ